MFYRATFIKFSTENFNKSNGGTHDIISINIFYEIRNLNYEML